MNVSVRVNGIEKETYNYHQKDTAEMSSARNEKRKPDKFDTRRKDLRQEKQKKIT